MEQRRTVRIEPMMKIELVIGIDLISEIEPLWLTGEETRVERILAQTRSMQED